MLEQPIDGTDGGVRLSRARRHLDEGTGAIVAEGVLQVFDSFDLTHPQSTRVQWWQILQAGPERMRFSRPGGQDPRTVEIEHLPRTGIGVPAVGEAGDDTGALVNKRQGVLIVHPLEGGCGITLGLLLRRRDLLTPGVGLRLDDADSLPLRKEHVIRRSDVGLVLAHRNARGGVEIDSLVILNNPTCR